MAAMKLTVLVLFALGAVALGQEITKSGLDARIAALKSKLGPNIPGFNAATSLGPSMTNSLERLAEYEATSTSVEDGVSTIQSDISSLKEEVTNFPSDSEVEDALAALELKLTQAVTKDKEDMATTAAAIEKTIGEIDTGLAAVSTISADLATSLGALRETGLKQLDAPLATKMNLNRHIWSGGARNHGPRNNWGEFTLDRSEFDTALPYFTKHSNTRFRILQDGMYRLNWWSIQQGGNCHGHARVRVQNSAGNYYITNHYHNMLTWGGNWNDIFVDITVQLKKDDQLYIYARSCGHAWHGAGQNSPNAYNRIQVEYVGTQGDNCSGPFCKGI